MDKIEKLIRKLEMLDYKCLKKECYYVDWKKCFQIIKELMNLNKERSFQEMVVIFKNISHSENPDEYSEAIDLLIEIGIKNEEFIKYIKDWIKDCLEVYNFRPNKADQLIRLLKDLDIDEAIKIALRYVNYIELDFPLGTDEIYDYGKKIRKTCARILGEYRINEGVFSLKHLLNDYYEDIASTAAWALGEIGKKEIIDYLLPYASGYLWQEGRGEYNESMVVFYPDLKKAVCLALSKLNYSIDEKQALVETLKEFSKDGKTIDIEKTCEFLNLISDKLLSVVNLLIEENPPKNIIETILSCQNHISISKDILDLLNKAI